MSIRIDVVRENGESKIGQRGNQRESNRWRCGVNCRMKEPSPRSGKDAR